MTPSASKVAPNSTFCFYLKQPKYYFLQMDGTSFYITKNQLSWAFIFMIYNIFILQNISEMVTNLITSLTHAFRYGIWFTSPGFIGLPWRTLVISSYNLSCTEGLKDSWYRIEATAFDVCNKKYNYLPTTFSKDTLMHLQIYLHCTFIGLELRGSKNKSTSQIR